MYRKEGMGSKDGVRLLCEFLVGLERSLSPPQGG